MHTDDPSTRARNEARRVLHLELTPEIWQLSMTWKQEAPFVMCLWCVCWSQTHITKLQMLRDVYGEALPLRMHIEEQILNRFHRLPGLPSSKLGLESLTGTLDEFSFESYLGLPEQSEVLPPDMHAQMEAQLGMGTKPQARGIF